MIWFLCRVKRLLIAALCVAFTYAAVALDDAPAKNRSHIVFLISEDPDNYEAHKTIPLFAEHLREAHNFQVTVLKGDGPREGYRFPGLDTLNTADLLVVFCRRLALPPEQMERIRDYLRAGKPLVGLRTANHAFSVRDKVMPGFEDWWDFVPEILGCENKGYGPVAPGTDVAIVSSARKHPILKGIAFTTWHSHGNVYLVAPLLDKDAKVLLVGTVEDKTQPIAWTRLTEHKGRVFYTSLGYPDDFATAHFQQLLVNGIYWTLDRKRRNR